jgi:hypothetical protein
MTRRKGIANFTAHAMTPCARRALIAARAQRDARLTNFDDAA